MSWLDVAIAATEAQLAELRAQKRSDRASRTIFCACGEAHAIKDLTVRVTHWYTEPHGCTDGDYWTEGEWQFLCPGSKSEPPLAPKGAINRILFDDWGVDYKQRDTIGVAAEPTFKSLYRHLFKERVEVHDRNRVPHDSYWVNNRYVDDHRAAFELPEKPKRT